MIDNTARKTNSTKHGINIKGIMRCKKQKCYYKEICYIWEELESYPYGAPCLIEKAKEKVLREEFEKDLGGINDWQDVRLISELIIVALKKMRCESAIAIGPSIFDIGEDANEYAIPPHVLYRYYQELSAKYTKLLFEAKDFKAATSP